MSWFKKKKKNSSIVWFLLCLCIKILHHPFSIPTLQVRKLRLSSGQYQKLIEQRCNPSTSTTIIYLKQAFSLFSFSFFHENPSQENKSHKSELLPTLMAPENFWLAISHTALVCRFDLTCLFLFEDFSTCTRLNSHHSKSFIPIGLSASHSITSDQTVNSHRQNMCRIQPCFPRS